MNSRKSPLDRDRAEVRALLNKLARALDKLIARGDAEAKASVGKRAKKGPRR